MILKDLPHSAISVLNYVPAVRVPRRQRLQTGHPATPSTSTSHQFQANGQNLLKTCRISSFKCFQENHTEVTQF
jgi:hypothetical protein